MSESIQKQSLRDNNEIMPSLKLFASTTRE